MRHLARCGQWQPRDQERSSLARPARVEPSTAGRDDLLDQPEPESGLRALVDRSRGCLGLESVHAAGERGGEAGSGVGDADPQVAGVAEREQPHRVTGAGVAQCVLDERVQAGAQPLARAVHRAGGGLHHPPALRQRGEATRRLVEQCVDVHRSRREVLLQPDHPHQPVTRPRQSPELVAHHDQVGLFRFPRLLCLARLEQQVDVSGGDGERGAHLVRGQPGEPFASGRVGHLPAREHLGAPGRRVTASHVTHDEQAEEQHQRDLGELGRLEQAAAGVRHHHRPAAQRGEHQCRQRLRQRPRLEAVAEAEGDPDQVVGDHLRAGIDPHPPGAEAPDQQPGPEQSLRAQPGVRRWRTPGGSRHGRLDVGHAQSASKT